MGCSCTSLNAGLALSDEEVVGRVRSGEIALYEILVKRHHRRLYLLTRRMLRDDAEAEDVTQEVHLKVLTRLDQFAARSSFAKWLTRIALNEALSRLRTRARRPVLAFPEPGPDRPAIEFKSREDDPEMKAMTAESSARVTKVLQTLPEIYRAVFITRELEEMSTAETASSLGVTDQCVKTRLNRARSLLKRKYVKVREAGYPSRVYTC